MLDSYEFLNSVINTVSENIAVIDSKGDIQFVNRSWQDFGENNNSTIKKSWEGINYIGNCELAAEQGDDHGARAAEGIKKVIGRKVDSFQLEYDCHSPEQKRWFAMTVRPFLYKKKRFFVIAHQDITTQKLAEEKALKLSRLDGLTNIANRRAFDEFLVSEWRRCVRQHSPISLAMIDIDHFKLLNDTYGHQEGDECLKKIASILKKYGKRPGDICARFGGEEFVLLLGGTSQQDARKIVSRAVTAIKEKKIPNKKSPVAKIVTASAGLATMHPKNGIKTEELVQAADTLLYHAKDNGRDKMAFEEYTDAYTGIRSAELQ